MCDSSRLDEERMPISVFVSEFSNTTRLATRLIVKTKTAFNDYNTHKILYRTRQVIANIVRGPSLEVRAPPHARSTRTPRAPITDALRIILKLLNLPNSKFYLHTLTLSLFSSFAVKYSLLRDAFILTRILQYSFN